MTSNPTHQQGTERMRTAQDGGQSDSESKETDSGAFPRDVMRDVTQESDDVQQLQLRTPVQSVFREAGGLGPCGSRPNCPISLYL
jgi:hypothetical protein